MLNVFFSSSTLIVCRDKFQYKFISEFFFQVDDSDNYSEKVALVDWECRSNTKSLRMREKNFSVWHLVNLASMKNYFHTKVITENEDKWQYRFAFCQSTRSFHTIFCRIHRVDEWIDWLWQIPSSRVQLRSISSSVNWSITLFGRNDRLDGRPVSETEWTKEKFSLVDFWKTSECDEDVL